ncbi:hypothetical protein LARI1_G007416 [Lachnellula arida]|uniref:Uncharacterized protein n=1 Tax=Lachnellula arida TaxID=1316785 RepID=A0A8T9BEA0_9HELO|nr:hypothetical protein LARI1_G007416 [Lachnellula arida]
MAEQMGTPGSNADTSINGSKAGKDKACPFCRQQFTSSSLGRHLDLYIKDKNPKPPDGLHDVDEIRKLRGGITRRQPRNSTSKRESSTPAGTPSAHDRRSPRPESASGNHSPRKDDNASSDRPSYHGKPTYRINKPTWEATGVMNVIPPSRSGDSAPSWDGGDERDAGRKVENRARSVSKQMLAKTTFEQKQKMIDALDNAKAAELALRELLGSIRAAKKNIEGPTVFDYDPLTLDFPALCLHCLPPPPTLYQSTPLPNSSSWSIFPPDDHQYQALRSHFSSEFHRWRVSCAIANTIQPDDLSYPPPPHLFAGLDDPAEMAQRAEASASELESRISEHLHSAFAHWNGLSPQKRQEIWMLEFARNVGKKSQDIEKLKKEKEFIQQEATHLKQQVDELSRLQQPREFRMLSPRTVGFSGELMTEIGELGTKYEGSHVGFDLMDRHVHLDTAIERAVGRWKSVIKSTRSGGNGNGGMASQRSLSGESAPPTATTPLTNQNPQLPQQQSHQGQQTHQRIAPAPSQQQQQPQMQNHNRFQNHQHSPHQLSNNNHMQLPNQNQNHHNQQPQHQNHNPPQMQNGMDSDQDADADADMDDDESFVEMDAPAAKFRLSNGTGARGGGGGTMEGLEHGQVVQGYVRIGA